MADDPLTAPIAYGRPWGVRSPHPYDGVRQTRASDAQETGLAEAERLTGRGEPLSASGREPYRPLPLCRIPLPGGTAPAAHPGRGS
ncbi:hypothetical protein ABZ946_32480 [Streptomyces sp. NPDC046324]|uniref:hypothetical protein n=1 Tax=Streptomyces sp. NPDC046324 TaxID=3154915 RepID=UPI0033ED3182